MSRSSGSRKRSRRSSDDSPPAEPRRRSRWPRRFLLVFAILGVLLAGSFWWQEHKLSQAEAALQSGETKYAIFLVTKFLDGNPGHTGALAIQARGLVKLGRPDEAIAIFGRIGAASVEDLRALSQAYMLREEWTTAYRLLNRSLQMRPDDPDALYEIASCEMRLGRYVDALEHAQQFVEHPGQAARGHVLMGSIFGSVRNQSEAAKSFEAALREEPEGENLQIPAYDVFLRYGRVLMALGQPEKALEPLRQCVARREVGEAFALLGDAASQLGKPENAKQAWKKAVQVEPDNLVAREALANVALLSGDGKEALQWLQPIGQNENLTPSVAYLFQRTFTLLEDKETATKWQEKAAELRRRADLLSAIDGIIAADPHAFWSRAALAHQFASEGNWTQAELLVTGLVEAAPGEPFIIELTDAVRRRSELPDLTRIPVVRF